MPLLHENNVSKSSLMVLDIIKKVSLVKLDKIFIVQVEICEV